MIEGRESAHSQRTGELQHPAHAGAGRGHRCPRPRGRHLRHHGVGRAGRRTDSGSAVRDTLDAFGDGAALREADGLEARQDARGEGGKVVGTGTLQLKVLPFRLVEPADRGYTFGVFYGGMPSSGAEFRQFKQHGIDAVQWFWNHWFGVEFKNEDGKLKLDLREMDARFAGAYEGRNERPAHLLRTSVRWSGVRAGGHDTRVSYGLASGWDGGRYWTRTSDLYNVSVALYRLS